MKPGSPHQRPSRVGRDGKFGLIVSHSGGMPGVITWFERFLDADRVLVLLSNRDPEEYRAFAGFYNGMQKIARDRKPDPVQTIEEIAVRNPDKSKWESFCGKYEHPEEEDFLIDRVFMKDGELYADAVSEEYGAFTFRLYPLGENKFGRKGGMVEITFGENCLICGDQTCRKR